ncbi:MAG: OB-fold nucleic acid binding domain-containing protein [Candidatus Micrarchaeota archaeon]|nr:OB-fold nucleic acid binding domain-containing protein [Candidatus Micrarchaeota archaeon]
MEQIKIADLKAGLSSIVVEGQITSIQEPKEVITKYGNKIKVSHATLADETGSIDLTLWGEDSSRFKVGDRLLIEDCFVSEFKGNLQLSIRKGGKIKLL